MLGEILDVVFPRRCAGCGRGPWPFCGDCRERVLVLGRPWCRRCGAPTPSEVPGCRDCPPAPITLARSAFAFEGPIRSAIHRLKFSGWRDVGRALGEAMVSAWDSDADAVTWVPLSDRRRRERGFDQARALARVVGPGLGLPVLPLLERRGDPGPQARRGRAERLAAMQGRFSAVGEPQARVLLVDDVLTTGATAAACALALAEAGAREVAVLTAARALPGLAARQGPGRLPGRRAADILGDGLAFGSVVAPGNRSPAVDASRGRNDPRKATLGR